MPSAIAKTNIFPGAAVAQSKDTVSLAGGSLLATHIVSTGAIQNGIIAMQSSGRITLNDWTLATGARQLFTGATYYTGTSGMLSTFGSQPIGIAVSPITLSVTIQNQSQGASSSTSSSTTSSLQSQIDSLQSQIYTLRQIPAGGTTDQVLTKLSNGTGDVGWETSLNYASLAKYGAA